MDRIFYRFRIVIPDTVKPGYPLFTWSYHSCSPSLGPDFMKLAWNMSSNENCIKFNLGHGVLMWWNVLCRVLLNHVNSYKSIIVWFQINYLVNYLVSLYVMLQIWSDSVKVRNIDLLAAEKHGKVYDNDGMIVFTMFYKSFFCTWRIMTQLTELCNLNTCWLLKKVTQLQCHEIML